jgi:thiosulfate reductase cytochrome b subunit
MIRFYLGVIPMRLLRRPWPHPAIRSKYNALQRAAIFLDAGARRAGGAVGWAMHKPVQLGWLERMFVSYDGARLVHFVMHARARSFIVPHVILAIVRRLGHVRSNGEVGDGRHACGRREHV